MSDQIEKVLLRVTHSAGEILMNYYGRLENIDTKTKDIDLVTVADHKSEEFIIGELQKAFPTHDIISEETGGRANPSSEFRWVIDPLDGTTNFAHSYPAFCVSIGIQKNGQSFMGAVYNPYYDEFFFAERDKGAFLNQKPITVSKTREISKSLLLTGFAYDRRERADHYLRLFRALMMRCHGVRRAGAAALDICSVACGRAEGYWEENLKPWDTAAGWLILEEAGGQVSDFKGKSFAIEKKQILATNGKIHEQMIAVLSGG